MRGQIAQNKKPVVLTQREREFLYALPEHANLTALAVELGVTQQRASDLAVQVRRKLAAVR